MIPAAGQGAIGGSRTDDKDQEIKRLNHIESLHVFLLKEWFFKIFGFMFSPIAAFANFDDDGKITINSMISNDDGTLHHNVKEYAQRDTVMDIWRYWEEDC
ncbi:MAG: hypothetical protein CM15mP111_3980 [Hyphomicrobiales bacterium]|nr:MAG: hypothetical protein CM15mP111_3980 [Hyphomicrobiales bacterium]